MQKIVEQLDIDLTTQSKTVSPMTIDVSEEKATLIFIIDTYSRHLLEIEGQPTRKIREQLDQFTKDLLQAHPEKLEKTYFRIRQFFSTHRLDEYTYVHKTLEDFRTIIWDFIEQLSEEFQIDKKNDIELNQSFHLLKDAVEANSIPALKNQARQFIDQYIEFQTRKDERRDQRMHHLKKNLDQVKNKLVEANQSMKIDHLTQVNNRLSFDEHLKQQFQFSHLYQQPVCLMMLDIDHFKKINDQYGHPVGDFILQECCRVLKSIFHREHDFVARVGGEEFAIILPYYQVEHAVVKAEQALQKIRSETYIKDEHRIQFTISIGVAELNQSESIEQWYKRADSALYLSKNSGRNKFTVAGGNVEKVA